MEPSKNLARPEGQENLKGYPPDIISINVLLREEDNGNEAVHFF